jgi:tRNA A-37 threonylcarbamoyl transferase component Bud32
MQSQPTADPLLGTTVAGRYKVIKLLGEGGMGQVYLAEHSAIEKRIALKVLRAEYAHKGEIVTRFQQEAISASRIKHPNVLDVFDFGQLENGCFYLAMEFLEGNDLADELQRARQLTAARALPIAMQICRALSAAHSKGVVHRDMKPENVFLQRTGDGEEIVKIVDFGIAQLKPSNEEAAAQSTHRRLTRTGMIFGTPEYMAPEQASGKHADLRCDIYAVGIILFELFTGAVPFTGETFLGVLTKHLNEMPPSMRAVYPDLQISPELEGVVQRTLAKDPSYRYQTMNELAQALAGTPEGQYAGLRGQYSQVMGDGRGSVVPGGAGQNPSPTAQQFVGNPSMPRQPGSGPELTDAARAAVTMPRQDTGVEARAETQLGGEAATRPPVKAGGGGALVLALLGVLAAGGGTAAFFMHGASQPQLEPSAQARPAAPPPAQVAPEPPAAAPSVPAVAPPVPSVAAPIVPADVKLEVITDPPGATLMKNGFQVCDQTPCEVTATVNETLELSGEKGPLKGKAKVLAQKDQKVTIKLAAPVAAPPKPRMCEVEIDGLKILRPCP